MKDKKKSLDYRVRSWMLPGLKRYILMIALSIASIIFGVLWLLDKHPLMRIGNFVHEMVSDYKQVLSTKANGIIAISVGGLGLFIFILKMTQEVLGAYLPEDREAIPDVLYRRRYLERGPKVVVIGGGTGLSNLLKGLKRYTNNITAIVTVGDDGGSSGRLRQELGVLPPGDIRNCITALADEEKIVTELFRYRFESGEGLEGHSFGNLFLTAVCAITHGDMIEAVRTASRVLNSCGQVLPSTLDALNLMAEFEDGTIVRGESHITEAGKRIKRLFCEPAEPHATEEALEAIYDAELIVLGPGNLYTSIIPNLIVPGIAEAVRRSTAQKIYICNVMTQPGETTDYSVGDHVQAILAHSQTPFGAGMRLMHAVLVSDYSNAAYSNSSAAANSSAGNKPVRFDPERLRELGVVPIRKALVSESTVSHHDPLKLARVIMMWFFRTKRKRPARVTPPRPPLATVRSGPGNS